MDKIQKHKQYEITNPQNGKVETWSGDRIMAYQKSYRKTVIELAKKEAKKSSPKQKDKT